MKTRITLFVALLTVNPHSARTHAQEADRGRVMEALRFHAGFEGNGDAVVAPGDKRIYTVESLARKQWTPGIARADVTIAKGEGVKGDCLRFGKKAPQVICFKGESMPYKAKGWSGTVSFWMRLDPDKDLQPGHCDPIQITQKAWDNGALWVDFDKDLPRDFRLGCFSDFVFFLKAGMEACGLHLRGGERGGAGQGGPVSGWQGDGLGEPADAFHLGPEGDRHPAGNRLHRGPG